MGLATDSAAAAVVVHAAASAATAPAVGDTYMNLTQDERDSLQSVERFGASLSLVGISLILVTFVALKRLRTVPNTFIFFASIANVGACIACLIGYSGVVAGDPSPLCQAQSFLLEMFMQSDPYWSLAMAINVYVVFFHAFNPTSFRRYLWVYCVVCYGIPAVPAIVLLIMNLKKGGFYGNATLWCWISDEYNTLRIYTYYIPIWICILTSVLIYVAVGYRVFHQRNQLRNLTLSYPAKEDNSASSDFRGSGEKSQALASLAGQPYGTVTTEVQITAESSEPLPPTSSPPTPAPPLGLSTVVVPCPAHIQPPHSGIGAVLHPWDSISPLDDDSSNKGLHHHSPVSRSGSVSFTTTAGGGASVSGGHHHHQSPFTTTVSSTRMPSQSTHAARHSSRRHRRQRGGARVKWQPFARFMTRLRRLDPVKLAYLRTSFIFAISVLITWTPSSINRVFTLVAPQSASFGLNMASAVVLPLQGVWNAVIYVATSWKVLREEVGDFGGRVGWWAAGAANRRGSERLASTGAVGAPGAERFGSEGGAEDLEMAPRSPRGAVRVIRGASLGG